MSFLHDPGDTRDLDAQDGTERMRDEEWFEHRRRLEEERFSRLSEHKPLEQKEAA